MPEQKEVSIKYWCPGPWPWQWFRTCRKTELRWCYFFQVVKTNQWLVACTNYGCENGTEYKWTSFCLNVIGTAYTYNVEKCTRNQLNKNGECQDITSPPQVYD